jgi:UDP-N-acetylglucosamine 2-epimerase (non-hydrolysing)
LLNSELARVLEGKAKKGSIPPLWDGRAGERIAEVLHK